MRPRSRATTTAKKSLTMKPTRSSTDKTRQELLRQLREASVESLEMKERRRSRIKVRNVAGIDRRVVAGERLFLLALATVGLLLHALNPSRIKWSNAAALAVDYALAPFATGGVALLQLGLAGMLTTRKFIDPRLCIILDSMAALLYMMYLSVAATLPPIERNSAMLSLSIMAAVLHVAMIAQNVLTLRRLQWALRLESPPPSLFCSTTTISSDSSPSDDDDSPLTSNGHLRDSRSGTSQQPRPERTDGPPTPDNVSTEEIEPSTTQDEDQVQDRSLHIDPTKPRQEPAVTKSGESIPSAHVYTSESDDRRRGARTEEANLNRSDTEKPNPVDWPSTSSDNAGSENQLQADSRYNDTVSWITGRSDRRLDKEMYG